MTTAENIAVHRRIAALEAQIIAVDPVRVRTRFEIYERGDEVPCRTIMQVRRNATLGPVVRLVKTIPDLDVLIEPETGCHLVRARGDDSEFDELAEGVRIVDVVISCHAHQLEQIVSAPGITATTGGARAGKTRTLVWWFFRQWLLRGHGRDPEGQERAATMWWIREDSKKLYKHAIQWLLDLWPTELFVGIIPGPKTLDPRLYMVDGTVIEFHHANFSGGKAGTNLRSESVDALVVDELSAVTNEENWAEMLNRVGQTGGPIATAYTPFADHWSTRVVEDAAPESGDTIQLRTVDMFQNPWWPRARVYLAYLKANALTATQLLDVLDAADPESKAKELITDPRARARYFGEKISVGLRLWSAWDRATHSLSGPGFALESFELDGQQLPNITAQTVGVAFGRAGASIMWAGGVDFNINPGAAILFQVFGDRSAPLIYVFDEVSTVGNTGASAEHVARRYPGLCLHCDPTGAMDYRHASQGAKNMSNAEELELHGLHCEPANGVKGAKVLHLPQLDSINAMHRLMRLNLLRVHERCTGTLRALADMRAKPDGTIDKISGTGSVSDQVSAFGDALRYGIWPAVERFYLSGDAVAGQ